MEMEPVLILAIANILSLAYLAFLAGSQHELRRQTKVALDKEMENLKQSEQMLRLVKLAASKSESATDKSEPAPEPAAKEQNTEK